MIKFPLKLQIFTDINLYGYDCLLQWNLLKTHFIITWYYIVCNNGKCGIQIRQWTHKVHPRPHSIGASNGLFLWHCSEVIMSVMVSQITGVSLVHSTVCSGTDQRKYQSSASLAFARGTHWWPVNSPHKGPVTWKMFPFNDVIMSILKKML